MCLVTAGWVEAQAPGRGQGLPAPPSCGVGAGFQLSSGRKVGVPGYCSHAPSGDAGAAGAPPLLPGTAARPRPTGPGLGRCRLRRAEAGAFGVASAGRTSQPGRRRHPLGAASPSDEAGVRPGQGRPCPAGLSLSRPGPFAGKNSFYCIPPPPPTRWHFWVAGFFMSKNTAQS